MRYKIRVCPPSFNRWSRCELMHTEHTDHWSKLRFKSYRLAKLPTGETFAFCKSKDSVGQVEYTRERLGLPKVAVELPTLAHVGSPMLNEYLKNRLHNPFMIKTRLPKKPSFAPTGSNARAKLDFRYWYDELIDHKPLNAEKKIIVGAKGTYFGLGAPRL